MTEPLRVALVCVMHNSAAELPDFIGAATAALSACNGRVVFIDNESTDSSVGLAQQMMPDAPVIRTGANRGFAAGVNAGIEYVRRTFDVQCIAIVNPDILLRKETLIRLWETLRDPTVGIAVPVLFDEHDKLLYSLRNEPSLAAVWSEALLTLPLVARLGLPTQVIRSPAAYASPRSACWATGGMLVVSRHCADTVGDWDESFFMYEEEVEYCLRVADAGFALRLCPDAAATRIVGAGQPASWRYGLMRVNRVRLLRRRHGRAWVFLYRLALVIGDAMRAVCGRREARAGLWAVLTEATPSAVILRYPPGLSSGI